MISWYTWPIRRLRLPLLLAWAGLLAGCSVGDLSSTREIGLYSLGAPRDESIEPGRRRVVPMSARVASCGQGSGKAIAGIRPGVGARLQFNALSFGYEPQVGNPTAPVISPITISLRLVDGNSQLDAFERAALFSVFTTNRTSWPSAADDARKSVERELERHPAPFWNAFVSTLCIEVRQSGSTRVFVPVVDLSSICAAASGSDVQAAFAKTFINKAASDCRSTSRFSTLFGVDENGASTNWAAAALKTGAPPANPYYLTTGIGPVALEVTPQIDATRPFYPSPPGWTLREWEVSGICHAPNGVAARIIGLRFKGGTQFVEILDDPALAGTVRIETDASGLKEQLDARAYHWFGVPTLARRGLQALTAGDVDELFWAAPGTDGILERIDPQGCSRRG